MSELLKRKKWTLRQAAIATGVPYSTIDRIGKGMNVQVEYIAQFAYKIAEPENRFETVVHWLTVAQKNDFVSLLSAVANTARQIPDEVKTRVELPSGREILVLPSGREVETSPENIALMETMFGALEQAKQNR